MLAQRPEYYWVRRFGQQDSRSGRSIAAHDGIAPNSEPIRFLALSAEPLRVPAIGLANGVMM